MYVHTRTVKKLPSDVYRKLIRLNLGGAGLMMDTLRYFRTVESDARVFWIEQDGVILSWAILFRLNKKDRDTVYVYTRKTHRRMGLGSRIFRNVTKYTRKKLLVYPHDDASGGFFDSFKSKTMTPTKVY